MQKKKCTIYNNKKEGWLEFTYLTISEETEGRIKDEVFKLKYFNIRSKAFILNIKVKLGEDANGEEYLILPGTPTKEDNPTEIYYILEQLNYNLIGLIDNKDREISIPEDNKRDNPSYMIQRVLQVLKPLLMIKILENRLIAEGKFEEVLEEVN